MVPLRLVMAQSLLMGCVTMCDAVHAGLGYSALDAESTSRQRLR